MEKSSENSNNLFELILHVPDNKQPWPIAAHAFVRVILCVIDSTNISLTGQYNKLRARKFIVMTQLSNPLIEQNIA